jgi:hypothetical protein
VTPPPDSELVLIFDFGSPFARRVRELNAHDVPDDPGKKV